jgi:hypothetical protein
MYILNIGNLIPTDQAHRSFILRVMHLLASTFDGCRGNEVNT